MISEEAKDINITFELTAGPRQSAIIRLDDIKIRQEDISAFSSLQPRLKVSSSGYYRVVKKLSIDWPPLKKRFVVAIF